MRFDAVVLGAGPAGSSAAFSLARAGWRVALVEKAAFPRRKVCGEFVSATTFPVLDAMGVGDALRRAGGPPIRRVGLYVGDRRVIAPMPAHGSEGYGRTLARAALDPVLADAAQGAGATLFQPWKAVAMEGRTVTIEGEGRTERLDAPVVVAAHGSWEASGLPTQPSRPHAPGDVLAFKAFFHGATFPDDLMILAGFPGGYAGMVHRDADTLGLSFCVRRDVLQIARAWLPGSTAWEALLAYVAEGNRGIREAMDGARLESPPKAAGPLNPGIRPLAADGVYRVGNAAGEAHPTIAEGISMAIQSGWLLAQALIPGERGAPERYARAWRGQFGARIRTADLFARFCMSPALGRAMVVTVGALPAVLTAGAALSGKTKPLRLVS